MTSHATPIDRSLLAGLSAEAAAAPRRRKNRNFHEPDSRGAHRLLNAIEPGSYVAPHRHNDPTKDETMVVVAGRFGMLFFDDGGQVLSTVVAEPGGPTIGVDIPHGTWHAIVALAPGSIFFESKTGPYVPLGDDERAPWAPAEGHADAPAYLATLEALFERASAAGASDAAGGPASGEPSRARPQSSRRPPGA